MVILKHFWPAMAWALLVLILTGLPGNYFPEVPTLWNLLEPDKIVHLFIFGVFTVLLALGLTGRYGKNRSSFAIAALSIGTGIAYGGITELLQGYVFIGRTASIYDFIANFIGCFAGYLLFKFVLLKYLEKEKKYPL
jgi:VanZ family protein